LFIKEIGKKSQAVAEFKLDLKKDAYSLQDYEDLLARISVHVQQ
jgi:hypothetical protein